MTILDRNRPDIEAEYTAEADVIVTAAILGYSATRIHQEQPFSFDIEYPTQKQQQ